METWQSSKGWRLKLVAHKEVWELYNLESDPVEEINLIEKEKGKANRVKRTL